MPLRITLIINTLYASHILDFRLHVLITRRLL